MIATLRRSLREGTTYQATRADSSSRRWRAGSTRTASVGRQGAVAADLDAGRGGLGGHELEPSHRTVGREQRLAAAERDRLDEQDQLVDELRGQQCPHEREAAVDVDVGTGLLTQLGDLLEEGPAAENRRGMPGEVRVRQGVGHD